MQETGKKKCKGGREGKGEGERGEGLNSGST